MHPDEVTRYLFLGGVFVALLVYLILDNLDGGS